MHYPWLDEIYNKITSSIINGTGHHAMLLNIYNKISIDKFVFQLSKFILCNNKQMQKACDECKSCLLFNSYNHPDFYCLDILEDKKEISIDQIRDIINKINEYAHQSNNKVIYISNVHLLNVSSSNALLKLLEEPPANCYFLIQNLQAKPVLPTVYSRCQNWDINKPLIEDSLNWLKTQIDTTEDNLYLALQVNSNDPILALDFLNKEYQTKRLDTLRAFWLLFKNKDITAFKQKLDENLIETQFNWILDFILDCMKLKLNIVQTLICSDIYKGLQQYSRHNEINTLISQTCLLQNLLIDIKNNNLNKELVLNYYLIKFIFIQ